MAPLRESLWLPRGEATPPGVVAELAERLGVRRLTAALLARRGFVDAEAGRAYLQPRLADLPDPGVLPGMAAAVGRLCEALRKGEPIQVHGDYDVDGITGTALLVETLLRLGGRVDYHIPLRLRDGYGLSAEALRQAAAMGIRLVVTVDCGISASAEAMLARDLGLDLIVTDHHQPPEQLPPAAALVNPHLLGDATGPFGDLSGVGVAFFLLVALRRKLREEGWFATHPEPDLREGLDLVALGTIADIVPLRGVNRTLVRAGLELLDQGRRPGVRVLKEVAGIGSVTCGTVGFGLAPRLNAAGRLEDAAAGVELLLGGEERDLHGLARLLDDCNRERREIEARTLEEALALLKGDRREERYGIVLAAQEWHPGVIGIVASRLVERFHRPVVMVALDGEEAKGSGRSIPGFHLFRELEACREHLRGFGGHEFAAGLSLRTASVPDFTRVFEAAARSRLSPDQLVPRCRYDLPVLLEELEPASVGDLARLAPFGAGNPEPVLLAEKVRLQNPRIVGKKHLQFTARQGGHSHPCIAFGRGETLEELPDEADLLFHAAINTWRGRSSVQLRIRELRPAEG